MKFPPKKTNIHPGCRHVSVSLSVGHIPNYPVIVRILGFWIAPHFVGTYIIPGFLSSPQIHRGTKILWLEEDQKTIMDLKHLLLTFRRPLPHRGWLVHWECSPKSSNKKIKWNLLASKKPYGFFPKNNVNDETCSKICGSSFAESHWDSIESISRVVFHGHKSLQSGICEFRCPIERV